MLQKICKWYMSLFLLPLKKFLRAPPLGTWISRGLPVDFRWADDDSRFWLTQKLTFSCKFFGFFFCSSQYFGILLFLGHFQNLILSVKWFSRLGDSISESFKKIWFRYEYFSFEFKENCEKKLKKNKKIPYKSQDSLFCGILAISTWKINILT